MSEPLREMNLSEVLDRTAQIYRSRFLVFLGIGVIPAGTLLVSAFALFALLVWVGRMGAAASGSAMVAAWLMIALVFLLGAPAVLGATAFGGAAMCDAAARLYLGEKITIRDSFKFAWKRGWSYIGLLLLQALVIASVPVVIGSILIVFGSVMAALSRQPGAAASAMLGGLMFLVIVALSLYTVWMLLRLCLAFPVSVVERVGPVDALKRAAVLSKGTRLRILVLFLLGAVLGWVLSLGLALPAVIVLAFLPSLKGPQHADALGLAMMLVFYGSSFAVQAFIKPIYGIALTLFYFDQRIRKEGFDIEWMMQGAGLIVAPPPQPEAAPWLPPIAAPNADALPQGAPPDEPTLDPAGISENTTAGSPGVESI